MADMSQDDFDFKLDEDRIARRPQEGDDDISPLKYYGAIFLVVVLILGMLSLFFV